MTEETSAFYEFGRFRVKADERVLRRGEELVSLTPKAFDILLTLLENAGRIVNKDDLMKKVWPNTFVEEGNLTQNVSLLRKALGESATGPQFIETVPRRGYRFVAAVNRGNGNDQDAATENGTRIPKALSAHSSLHSTELHPVNAGPWTLDVRCWTFLSGRAAAVAITLAAVLVTIVGIAYFSGRDKAGATSAAIQSIAVLPFVDDSPNGDAGFLDDEIAESLVNSLTKLPKLRVVPRSVMVSYKGRNVDPRKR
jgi:DNA-binding winged helix-turn-helix (wHTH) protein